MRILPLVLVLACAPILSGCTDGSGTTFLETPAEPSAAAAATPAADASAPLQEPRAPPDDAVRKAATSDGFVASGDEQASGGEAPSAAPPRRQSPDRHGPPLRLAGEVEVVPADAAAGRPMWTVAQTLLVQNGDAGAARVEVQAALRAGAFRVQAWEHPGYRVVARLEAEGPDEQRAREAFGSLGLVVEESLAAEHLLVRVRVDEASVATATAAGSAPMFVAFRLAEVVLYVPPEPVVDLQVRTSSAPIEAVQVRGPRLHLASAGGDLRVEGGRAARLLLASDGGAVAVSGFEADEATVLPGFGDVDLAQVRAETLRVADAGALRLDAVQARVLVASAAEAEGSAVADDLRLDADGPVTLALAAPRGGTHTVASADGAVVVQLTRSPGDGVDAFAGGITGAEVVLRDGTTEETLLGAHPFSAQAQSAAFASAKHPLTLRATSGGDAASVLEAAPAPSAP